MSSKKYYIKGMVCERCIDAVRMLLERLSVNVLEVSLGEVELVADQKIDEALLEKSLNPLGLSLLKDRKLLLIKEVKSAVAEVYSGSFDFTSGFQFSRFISQRLGLSYKTISATFSSVERMTLEKYIIDCKIGKIKELLVYTNDTLSDIAYKLGYSSSAHLSKQFTNNTGLNPSYFKGIKSKKNAVMSNAVGS